MNSKNFYITILKVTIIFCSISSVAFCAQDSLEAIAQRIAPVGKVNVAGKNSSKSDSNEKKSEIAAAKPQQSTNTVSNGEKIYQKHCQLCHASGVAGAPKLVADAWQARAAKGLKKLTQNAIQGYNAMPAKGGCSSCSDADIESAVKYMLEQAKVKV